jgi:hypothetical protein
MNRLRRSVELLPGVLELLGHAVESGGKIPHEINLLF